MGAGDTACLFFLRLKILKTFCITGSSSDVLFFFRFVTRRYDDFRVLTSIFVIRYFNYGVLVRAVHRSLRGVGQNQTFEKNCPGCSRPQKSGYLDRRRLFRW